MIEIKHRFTGAVLLTLDRADLRSADLRSADLRSADLQSAYLRSSYLSGADLSGAYLSGADLSGAYLAGADLRSAYLRSAYLRSAYLRSAYLSGADLSGADLSGAYLRGADLSGADLSGANLSGANLSGANLERSNIYLHRVAGEGELLVYKKCIEGIVTLKIPGNAARVNRYGSRKCRAEFAIVLSTPNDVVAHSSHLYTFEYRAGQRVTPNAWDPSPHVECGGGIHFFVTREEAENY
ncbi:MAG: pentapeptide repeat-containing protein [Nocardiaceae bacterium]|nr:pentapeptide repeat-containing protein [Nocardiaceae bacterium]